MTPLERMRSLFQLRDRTPQQGRYVRYGLYDAHTGELVSRKFRTRAQAEAAKAASGSHRLRVRGVPPKKKAVVS